MTATRRSAHENRLGLEKSPYLLQHRYNPVDWYPWGDEAFAAARAQDRPIFLSVGYATCHWCHVMEHESFEDEEVAALLNRFFICIKVDREEHPDVDQIYMNAVQAMGQRGGWPMSIVMTPELQPFFGGTYFPKVQFMSIMGQLARAWQVDRSKVLEVSANLSQHLRDTTAYVAGSASLSDALLRKAYTAALETFDPLDGGFGTAPKFPPSMQLRLLMRVHRRFGETRALEMVETTLDRMARGGIYDHVGGGFARYSTDKTWLVPHFEKMLYDNALLATTYLEAYQLTRKPMYAAVARETLDYVLRDMTSAEGGFYTAEDADSEGQEGKFYVWTRAGLEQVLSKEELEAVVSAFGVTAKGNFEHGTHILSLRRDLPWEVKAQAPLAGALEKLFRARETRVHPLKDDKQLTSWNSLMIGAMARGYQVLRDTRYLEAARSAARFLRERLVRDGRLMRRYREGDVRYEGTLEDYAYLVQALITLYQTDFDPAWIRWALELQKTQDDLFLDEKGGGYYYTSRDAKALLVRTREFTDGAIPNPNAVAALSLLELYHLTLDETYRTRAEKTLEAAGRPLEQYPAAFGQMLIALDFALGPAREIAVTGPGEAAETQAMLEALQTAFIPNRVLGFAGAGAGERLPLLEGKPAIDGKVTVYVCEGFACQSPTSDLGRALELAGALRASR